MTKNHWMYIAIGLVVVVGILGYRNWSLMKLVPKTTA